MEIYRLRSFVLLAERLNFGETARLSNLSQPALSKQIRQLEVEIGAPLFDRGRHGAQLTAVGKLFVEEARLVVRQADLALERGQRAARGELGSLTVGFGFSTVTLVPLVISRFRRLHPEVEVEMRDMSTVEQLEALRAGTIDIGFVRLPVEKEFRSQPVLKDRLVLAQSVHHKPVYDVKDLSTLKRASFVMLPRRRSPSLYDQVLSLCARHFFHPRVIQEAHEFPTVLGLVAAGLGVAILPESQLRTRIEGVTVHPIDDPIAHWRVGAAWRKSGGSPLTAGFLKLLKEEVADT